MGNEYYSPGAGRASQVNRLFATIAPRYDLINDLQSLGLHRRWKQRVARYASVKPGEQALDLCCGTGDIAFALAKQGATVTGLDFSKEMLTVAEARTANLNYTNQNLRFIQGDAQKVPFPDAMFNIITVGYGLRNLESWEKGLSEMLRVAKPGGRIVVLDFGKPDNAVWRAFYFGYLRLCVPVFGLLFCGNASAYSYILESLKNYPAQTGIERKMRDAGLTNVRVENILGGAMSINYGEMPGAKSKSLPR